MILTHMMSLLQTNISLYGSNITPVIFGLFRMGKAFVRSSYGRIKKCKSDCVPFMSVSRFPKKGVGCGVELDSFFGGSNRPPKLGL